MPKTYVVTLTVMSPDPNDFANAVEQLARTAAGLSLSGLNCGVNCMELEDEGTGD